jgi:hypothetical protein
MDLKATDVEELKAKHGRVVALSGEGDETLVVVRPPKRSEWQRFLTQFMDESKRLAAQENLVRACVVAPDKAGLDALFEEKPACVADIAKALRELAGGGELEKKAL